MIKRGLIAILIISLFLLGCAQLYEQAEKLSEKLPWLKPVIEKAKEAEAKQAKTPEVQEPLVLEQVPADPTKGSEYDRFRWFWLELMCLKMTGQLEKIEAEIAVMTKYGFVAKDIVPLTKKYPDVSKDLGKRMQLCPHLLSTADSGMGTEKDRLLDMMTKTACLRIAGKITREQEMDVAKEYGYTTEAEAKAAIARYPEIQRGLAPRLLQCPKYLKKE